MSSEKRKNAVQILFVILGLCPVTLVGFHLLQWIDLYTSSRLFIPLAITLISLALFSETSLCSSFFSGWLMGILAVFLFDLVRWPFVMAGSYDYIPQIGSWILDGQAEWWTGYAWRYLGNGGGLGIAFVMLYQLFFSKLCSIKAGIAFGLSLFIGLLAILYVAPQGTDLMFNYQSWSCFSCGAGHIIYGGSLGFLSHRLNS